MKKTVTVNLNGRVFTIDEDAYRLLDNYLYNLRIYFRKEEGASEIIADFEARIEELFSERLRLGYEVISIEQVEEVIARVGNPADFSEGAEPEVVDDKQAYFTKSKDVKKKFFRNTDDKMFGGVCAGIAAYFGWDTLAVRIIFIILIFATSLWIIPVYLLAWLFSPGAYTAEQKLQMRGKPITVENIGKTVAAEVEPVPVHKKKGCLAGFIDLFVGLIKVFLIGLGCLIGLPLLFALIVIIIVLIAVLFGVGGGLLSVLPLAFTHDSSFLSVTHPGLATITFILVLGIPVVALVYSFIAHLAKLKPVNRAVKGVCFGIWLLALILFLSSGFRIDKTKLFNRDWFLYADHSIQGSGILSETEYVLEGAVDQIEAAESLFANLQIEQVNADVNSILISGDENLIDKVKYDLENGRLYLHTSKNYRLHSKNDLIIRIKTAGLKKIKGAIGNIQLNTFFAGDELTVEMNGAGKFQADSLSVNFLKANAEGVGSIVLGGQAKKAKFNMEGIGSIEAFDLVADTIYARVEGIGSIRCNPTEYLEGRLNGIGSITYKEEPKMKNVISLGIGKVGKH
jgi:phage shock protein PspC (stress-responsive transcriptional regulator)